MIADFTKTHRDIIFRNVIDGASSVLDAGCGDGEKTFYISPHVQFTVGIDPDQKIIKKAISRYRNKNLVFQVARAESLPFSNSSFSTILFNQTLHHVSVEKQLDAIKESHRVLKYRGKLLITEPISDSGSFGKMWRINNEVKQRKLNVINVIEAAIDTEFKLSLKKKIRIEYHCEGLGDFYNYYIETKPDTKWDENKKQDISNKLNRCKRSSSGNFILDYSAWVWLLIKR